MRKTLQNAIFVYCFLRNLLSQLRNMCMTIVRILSLGEIVTQNQMKTLEELALLINPEHPDYVKNALGIILQNGDTQIQLDKFKQGLITEQTFNSVMISKIKAEANKELTEKEFNKAWNAMNPKYAEFSTSLTEVIQANNQDQKIVFISYTNPKDINQLINELQENKVAYTINETTGYLDSIGGIPLYLTYSEKKSKANLIQQVITELKQPKINSFSIFSNSNSNSNSLDIKYIRGLQGISDPILKTLNDPIITEVESATQLQKIDTILWNKKDKQSFQDAINSPNHHLIQVSSL